MKTNSVTLDLTRFGGIGALVPAGRRPPLPMEDGGSGGFVPGVPRDRGIVVKSDAREVREEEGVKGKTIGNAGDTGDNQGQPPPAAAVSPFRYVGGAMDFGDVCEGWTPASWAGELRRKASRCEEYRPDIADHYRRWAADIEAKLSSGARD